MSVLSASIKVDEPNMYNYLTESPGNLFLTSVTFSVVKIVYLTVYVVFKCVITVNITLLWQSTTAVSNLIAIYAYFTTFQYEPRELKQVCFRPTSYNTLCCSQGSLLEGRSA